MSSTPEQNLRIEITVPSHLAGERTDKVLALVTGMTRSRAAQLVAGGLVRVDGEVVRTRSRALNEGELLEASEGGSPQVSAAPDAEVDFDVVYEDDDIIVVDKPAGLVVHHGAGHRGGTLVDGLLYRYPDLAPAEGQGHLGLERPGIVHRLDKGTSGLMVIARSARAYDSLVAQLKTRTAGRSYVALAVGQLASDAGVIDAPIGRSARVPTRMTVSRAGRDARTTYSVSRRFEGPIDATLLDVDLETGRTHQVRVHLAAIGHPVLGDQKYGGNRGVPSRVRALLGEDRFFLHARRLTLEHPQRGEMSWESELPADLTAVLTAFESASRSVGPEAPEPSGGLGPQ